MKASVKLLESETPDQDGYPIAIRISQGQSRPYKYIGRSWPEHFSAEAQMITDNHPDYDFLAPKILDYKTKARRIILQGKIKDPAMVLQELFKTDYNGITIQEFYKSLLEQMNQLAKSHEGRKDIKKANKIRGNIRVYENVMAQFNSIVPDIALDSLDYPTLLRFKNYQLSIGNSKNTVHQYLRTVRAIYNKGVLFHGLPTKKPFTGLFTGLTTKSYNNKKKYITKDSIRLLESMDLSPGRQMHIDLFLLQFYFGGSDLKDIFYLEKKQIRKGRVYFERGKTDTGLMIDLKIHPKAQAIINKYPSGDQWLFPWRKDEKGYETFRANYRRSLLWVQDEQATLAEQRKDKSLAIDVLPTGGKLGIKVARHTFGNIAKNLNIDTDLLRELMGHERNEVDNFYKDRFPEAVRDEALYKIIES